MVVHEPAGVIGKPDLDPARLARRPPCRGEVEEALGHGLLSEPCVHVISFMGRRITFTTRVRSRGRTARSTASATSSGVEKPFMFSPS